MTSARRSVWLVACIALCVASAPVWSADCMSPDRDETAEGRLTTGRFRDAADRPETAYILQLSSPVCLAGAEEEDQVGDTRRLHVAPDNDAVEKRFQSLLGKQVSVQGRPFGAHTAHHHAPIVMIVTKIDAR